MVLFELPYIFELPQILPSTPLPNYPQIYLSVGKSIFFFKSNLKKNMT